MKRSSIWAKFEFHNSENLKYIAKKVTGTHHVSVYLTSTLFFNKLNSATNFYFNECSILMSQCIMSAKQHT